MVENIPHWGINLVEPDAPYSVADFQTYARRIITEIFSRGHVPVLVGGTGLWLSAVIETYDLAHTAPDQEWRAAQAGKTAQELFEDYQKQDPEGAQKIDRFNARRLLRALEVIQQTGKSFFAQRQNREPLYDVLKIGLCPDRNTLYEWINTRVGFMMERGLVEEVRGLYHRYGCDLPSLSGIGYRQMCRFLQGEMTQEQAVEDIKKDTRHYAKRQWTWFKRDVGIHWIKTQEEAEELVLSFLR
jgi:tRNA dimethylallyltransferase